MTTIEHDHFIRIEEYGTVSITCKAIPEAPCHAIFLDCECEQWYDYKVENGVPFHIGGDNDSEWHEGQFKEDCFHEDWWEQDCLEGTSKEIPVECVWEGDGFIYRINDEDETK